MRIPPHISTFVSKCDGRMPEFILGKCGKWSFINPVINFKILIKTDKKIAWKIVPSFKLEIIKTSVQKR